MWVMGAHLGFLWLALAIMSVREAASRDLVSQLLCQVVAYGLTLFLMLRVHGPDTAIRAFIAWRPTRPGFVLLAAVMGLAAAAPAAWLLTQLEHAFPSAEPVFGFIELFQAASTGERVAIGLGVVVVGPLAEELIFRGAIFGPLLRYRRQPGSVIVFTAALFAVVHHDPKRMAPIFLVGLLLGVCRVASRSLLPSVALHLCFNVIPIAGLVLSDDVPQANSAGDEVDPWFALGGLLVVIACVGMTIALQQRQPSSR
jgi:membrane protease YdiL (CAAX protease family)